MSSRSTPPRGSTVKGIAERLFHSKDPKTHALIEIQRRFVAALASAGEGIEVAGGLERLVSAAAKRGPKRGGLTPTRSSDSERGAFASELLYALAMCWEAYRWEKNPAVLKGLSKRKLEKFPERVKALADDIEFVNASYYGSPVRQLAEMAASHSAIYRGKLRFLKDESGAYYDLPRILHGYAERLQRPLKPPGQRRGHPNLARDAEKRLVDLVKKRTKKEQQHLPEIARLLLAVYCLATGRTWATTRSTGTEGLLRKFNARSLAARLSRYREKGKQPASVTDFEAMLVLVHSIAPRLEHSP